MRACEVFTRVFETIDRDGPEAARPLLSDDFVKRAETGGKVVTFGPDEWLRALVPLDAAFGEMDHGVRCVADGPSRCAGTFNVRARHTGTLDLPHRGIHLAPTGRAIELPPEPFTAGIRDGLLAWLEVEHPDGGGIGGVVRQLAG